MRRYNVLGVLTVLIWGTALAGPEAGGTASDADGLARTPPMGWYPWNQFGQEPQNETLIRETAEALVASGMREVGYAFVGPDEGICFARDANGTLVSNRRRYPSGLRGLGDWLHGQGLKYALYTDAGTRTCSKAMPGTKDHEVADMRRFADWRCDYLKVDWCHTQGQDIVPTYTALYRAQRAAGRPLIHALCSWGRGQPWEWAAAVGHLWRTTGDICAPGRADWRRAVGIALRNQALHDHAGPGHWNDPDMLVVGMEGLSDTENRSLFSLWCFMAAPLIAGNDLRHMSPATVAILTNAEAIAVNQDPLGRQGHVVRREGAVTVWAGKPLFDGGQAVLVFNEGAEPNDVVVAWRDLGLDASAPLYARDLWAQRTTGPHTRNLALRVAPHGVQLLRVSRCNRFPLPPVVSADTYRLVLSGTAPAALHIRDHGSYPLGPWTVASPLPDWLTVSVTGGSGLQRVTCAAGPARPHPPARHAFVTLANHDPVSGKAVSTFGFDVDWQAGGAGR